MAWTAPTAIFVVMVLGGLVGLVLFAVGRPATPRKGFLPMDTTGGDRVYVGLLGAGVAFIGVLAFTSLSLLVGVVAAVVWMVVVVRWG